MTLRVKPANNKISTLNKKGGEDKIIISDIHLKTVIGVHDWEKKEPRDIIMTIELGVDISAAAKTDEINETVDYDELTQRLISFNKNKTFNLIETMAEESATLILKEFNVFNVQITLVKPQAMPFSKSVAVKIFREKTNV